MLKKRIAYTDFNDVKREEDFYFNLTKAEVIKMELSTEGGLEEKITRMVSKLDGEDIMTFFTQLLFAAYGEKSADGRRFVKSEELSKAFSETPAYDILFTELVTDPEKAAAFFNAIVPQNVELKESK